MFKRTLRIAGQLGLALVFVGICTDPGCQQAGGRFEEKPAVVLRSDQLRHTIVVAALDDTVVGGGENILWCGTFQLAWDQASSLAGGNLRLAAPEPSLAVALNRHTFGKTDLSGDCYVATAGYVRDGVFARIDHLMNEKFHGAAHPTLLPNRNLTPRPQDIVAYSYLFKKMTFPVPFERIESPLVFNGTEVECFGMAQGKPGHGAMSQHVEILDYLNADDFVIELKTSSREDHLVLAKITPGPSLPAMLRKVQKRIAASRRSTALPSDILLVPKMAFDVTRSYHELLGHPVVPTAPRMADDLMIMAADQDIHFLMDEKGVTLRSESRISMGCAASGEPAPAHRIELDKPLLLFMSHASSREPYFVCWVSDPELLVNRSQR